MLHAGVKEAAQNFAALVVGNDAPNFSAGANLMLAAARGAGRQLGRHRPDGPRVPGATQALRYADVPVVVVPAGLTLGGGCEIVLHGDRVQAAAESVHRPGRSRRRTDSGRRRHEGDAGARVERAAAAQPICCRSSSGRSRRSASRKVSTSAADARRLGFCATPTRVTMNRERLMADAKALALERVREGYRGRRPRDDSGRRRERAGRAEARRSPGLASGAHQRSRRADRPRAGVGPMAGGIAAAATTVSEQYLLDLEREAFLKLCGERKTLERIQYTLKTGKPLRN